MPTDEQVRGLQRRRRTFVGEVGIDPLTMSETLAVLEGLVESSGLSQHVVVNAAKVVAAQADRDLRAYIDQCAVVNADGMSVVWASRILGSPLPERVTGIDTMFALLRKAAQSAWPVYLLGARSDVITRVVSTLGSELPTLSIAGARNGYWSPEDEADVVRAIGSSGARILFIALPSPQKEHFIARNALALQVNLVVGVGGSFDIIAGETKRAPVWLQQSGLEWLFRCLQEPRRMWRRYLVGNSHFILLVARQWIGLHRRRVNRV